jgi:cytidylate kinase
MSDVRIVAIDGPSGSGKGTVAALVARHLGWSLLDSGSLYRLVGLAALRRGVDLGDESIVAVVARDLDVRFEYGKIYLDKQDVTEEIRTETSGNAASRVGALPAVRDALLERQRAFAQPPGLVADGRDMGTVVFPAAGVKIFLTASPAERAQRRYNQLIEKGFPANLAGLVEEIRERDERDASRAIAPLRPAVDAVVVDSTALSIEEVTAEVMARVTATWPDLAD